LDIAIRARPATRGDVFEPYGTLHVLAYKVEMASPVGFHLKGGGQSALHCPLKLFGVSVDDHEVAKPTAHTVVVAAPDVALEPGIVEGIVAHVLPVLLKRLFPALSDENESEVFVLQWQRYHANHLYPASLYATKDYNLLKSKE
jgi:hypothetical protein